MSKTELNKANLKILFGKNRLTKEERKLYDHIIDDEYKINPNEAKKYFPRKRKNSKTKVKRGRYE